MNDYKVNCYEDSKLIAALIRENPEHHTVLIAGVIEIIRRNPYMSIGQAIQVAQSIGDWADDVWHAILKGNLSESTVGSLSDRLSKVNISNDGSRFQERLKDKIADRPKVKEENIDLVIEAVTKLMEESGCKFHKSSGNEAFFDIPKTSRLHSDEPLLKKMSSFAEGMGITMRVKKEK